MRVPECLLFLTPVFFFLAVSLLFFQFWLLLSPAARSRAVLLACYLWQPFSAFETNPRDGRIFISFGRITLWPTNKFGGKDIGACGNEWVKRWPSRLPPARLNQTALQSIAPLLFVSFGPIPKTHLHSFIHRNRKIATIKIDTDAIETNSHHSLVYTPRRTVSHLSYRHFSSIHTIRFFFLHFSFLLCFFAVHSCLSAGTNYKLKPKIFIFSYSESFWWTF